MVVIPGRKGKCSDPNLLPGNIKKGVNILGVTGTLEYEDPDLIPGNIRYGVNIFGVQGSLRDERSLYFTDNSGVFYGKNWSVSLYPQAPSADRWDMGITLTLSGMPSQMLDLAKIVGRNLLQPIDAEYAVVQGDIQWKTHDGGNIFVSLGGGYASDAYALQYRLQFQSVETVDSGGIIYIRFIARAAESNFQDGWPAPDWIKKCNLRFVALMK